MNMESSKYNLDSLALDSASESLRISKEQYDKVCLDQGIKCSEAIKAARKVGLRETTVLFILKTETIEWLKGKGYGIRNQSDRGEDETKIWW
jgi:hypothetical protein